MSAPGLPEGPIRHVVLDRDGVLDREPIEGWIDDVADWRWERGALDAIARLAASSVAVSVVTNQSGVGRGVVPADRAIAVNEWLASELVARGVEMVGVFACYHAPDAGCTCRKPAPGLVLEAIELARVPPGETVLVGDAARDLDAGHAAGVAVALVRTGKGAALEASGTRSCPTFDDVGAAVAALLDL